MASWTQYRAERLSAQLPLRLLNSRGDMVQSSYEFVDRYAAEGAAGEAFEPIGTVNADGGFTAACEFCRERAGEAEPGAVIGVAGGIGGAAGGSECGDVASGVCSGL